MSNYNFRLKPPGGPTIIFARLPQERTRIVFVVEELTQTHITRFRTAVVTVVIIAGMSA